MADKKANPQLTSPRGVFVYPSIDKPDYGTKDYPKPDGVYKVTLRVPLAVADEWREGPLKAIIAQARAEAEAEFKKLPVATRKKLGELTWNEVGTTEYDKETEEETGFVLFKTEMKAGGKRKKDGSPWSQKPAVFDSKGKAIPKVPAIWGGSEGRVSVEASPYFIPGTGAAGVKLNLKAVMLLKLNSGSQKDASGFGFVPEEDGFDASDYQAPDEDSNPFDGEGMSEEEAAARGGDKPEF